MFFKHHLLLLVVFSTSCGQAIPAAKEEFALIAVPVADLLLMQTNKVTPTLTPEAFYKQLPLSPEKGPNSCPRYRQLRQHDMVKILGYIDDEVHIEAPTIVRYDGTTKRYEQDCFTLKKNIVPLNELRKKNLDYRKLIPSPSNRSIVLIHPWHDKDTDTWYSSGTQFVYSEIRDNHYQAYRLSTAPLSIDEIEIPQALALPLKERKKEDALSIFIDTLRSWCDNSPHGEGVMPYVWGGCSNVKRYKKRSFYIKKETRHGRELESWHDKHIKETPITGADCSGLILLAARVANIPYYFTNTTTITKGLKPVSSFEELREGDFIWCSGHIVIVDSLNENTVIHSQGYSHQTGCLHKAQLRAVFPNAKTFKDIFALKSEGKPLMYDKMPCKHFKVLSLSSVFSWKATLP